MLESVVLEHFRFEFEEKKRIIIQDDKLLAGERERWVEEKVLRPHENIY